MIVHALCADLSSNEVTNSNYIIRFKEMTE